MKSYIKLKFKYVSKIAQIMRYLTILTACFFSSMVHAQIADSYPNDIGIEIYRNIETDKDH
jgi:hypothetical protein